MREPLPSSGLTDVLSPSCCVDCAVPIRKPSVAKASKLDYSLNSTLAVEQLKIKPFLLEESFDLIEKKLVTGS